MGIHGLLPFIHKAVKQTNITNFVSKTAAVDGFVWMHRGCIPCCRDLALGKPNTAYISYFMKCCQQLINAGIKPLIVFDGANLPAKKETNEERQESRTKALSIALEMESHGMTAKAEPYYRSSIEITHEMLLPLFAALRKRHIHFIVAPYEADAQIAYLVRHHFADFAITEDSDLIVYQCPLMVVKLKTTGECDTISYEDVKSLPAFTNFSHDMITETCALSGCDYIKAPKGVGIRTAHKLISLYRTGESAINHMIQDPKWDVPADYKDRYLEVIKVFYEQRVYDPKLKKIVGFKRETTTDLAGPPIRDIEATAIAEGRMNPRTHEYYEGAEIEQESPNVSQTLPQYNIPVSPSASREFKAHKDSPEVPRAKPKRNPLLCEERMTLPTPTFMAPSLRMLKK